jgi:hypothetical protein
LIAVTWALATTAPDESRTIPVMAPVEAFWERAGKTSSPRITIVKAWIRIGIWASHFSEASAFLSGNAGTTQRSLRNIKKNVWRA